MTRVRCLSCHNEQDFKENGLHCTECGNTTRVLMGHE